MFNDEILTLNGAKIVEESRKTKQNKLANRQKMKATGL
jgi:hypothetical protein